MTEANAQDARALLSEREEFEEWATTLDLHRWEGSGNYSDHVTMWAWSAWMVRAALAQPATQAEPVAKPLLILSCGVYSDYVWSGPYVPTREFTIAEAVEAFKAQWVKPEGGWQEEPEPSEFEAWLASAGWVTDIPYDEVHVGSYGQIEVSEEAMALKLSPAAPVASPATPAGEPSEALRFFFDRNATLVGATVVLDFETHGEAFRALHNVRTALRTTKEPTPQDIARAEPWLRSSEVRERMEPGE